VGECWVVIFFAVKEQSSDYLVDMVRLGDESNDKPIQVDGQVEGQSDRLRKLKVKVVDQEGHKVN
jgi:hypothetical protein